MVALIIGIALVVASVLVCLPGVFGWWGDVLAFLRGMLPVLALLVGAIAILIGVADIKDKKEAEKEEKAEGAQEEKPAEK
jgi:hypothetical protein